jgi:orotidine-5'-phosphate decarboxylase
MDARERLIVALDVPSLDEALKLADTLGAHVGRLKLGLELFSRAGPAGIQEVAKRAPVMLDLKLHDIPATVSRTIRALAELEVEMATLHADGGAQMMQDAASAAPSLKLLAVTVLTSLDQTALTQVGVSADIKEVVAQRATLAIANGCAGVVASPREASLLRRLLGPGPLIVTPGVRPSGTDEGDQKRTSTPRAAIAAGADFVVVGRPIRDADDPVAAARGIIDEIAAGLESR